MICGFFDAGGGCAAGKRRDPPPLAGLCAEMD